MSPIGELIRSLDLTAPWYAAIRDQAQHIVHHQHWQETLNAASKQLSLTNHRALPIQFVEHSERPDSQPYESFISNTGKVPTRDNAHDLFNALVWLSFPKTKRQLNALQAAQIAASGVGKSRGPARDAATLFDENAALLVVTDDAIGQKISDALREHQWQQLWVEQRSEFTAHTQVWLFGHALMEKLLKPYKAITAHAFIVVAPDKFFAMNRTTQMTWLDDYVAGRLSTTNAEEFSTSLFTPLPVLGIPGWWPNQDDAFYQDTNVFRAKRNASRRLG